MPPLTITSDNIFKRDFQPDYEGLANYIEVPITPLVPEIYAEVYRSKEPIPINSDDTLAINCVYNDPPVIPINIGSYPASTAIAYETDSDGNETGSQLMITTGTEYYAWGADVFVYNLKAVATYFVIAISGHALIESGKESYITQDDDSVYEYGTKLFKVKKNSLIQTREMAKIIGDGLLSVYKQPRKDITLDWRGNPALELGDEIYTTIYDKGGITTYGTFMNVKQRIQFDGTLRATLDGRVV